MQYRFKGAPLYLSGPVVTGFGRGSSQMGVPTANIDPVPLADTLKQLPRGVYFGWARLDVPAGGAWSEQDRAVHKMVMNVGRRPTVSEGDATVQETVEVHVLHKCVGLWVDRRGRCSMDELPSMQRCTIRNSLLICWCTCFKPF